MDRHGPALPPIDGSIAQHVVIIGHGRVGQHIVSVLGKIAVPHLVIESDARRIEALNQRGVPGLYGDAANSEVLAHAGLSRAQALVVTIPDEAASQVVVAAARELAPALPIIARAATEQGVQRLAQLGAQTVIHPEMEGGLEIVRHTLLQLDFPLQEISRYTDAVRQSHYDLQINTEEEHRLLHNLLGAADNIEIRWFRLPPDNPMVGQTLAEADLRARTGASVVAILRDGQLSANPKSSTVFAAGDRLGMIGDDEQIQAAELLLSPSEENSQN